MNARRVFSAIIALAVGGPTATEGADTEFKYGGT